MSKLTVSFIVIIAVSMFSCNIYDNDLFSENNITVTRFDNEDHLTGNVLIDDAYGYYNVGRVGNYLVLFSVQREHFFYVYSIIGDSLGCFGIKGQGPTDLINNRWCGQCDNQKMWINDVSNARLCSINVEQSLAQKKCVFDSIIRIENIAANTYIIKDSSVLSEEMRDDNFYLIETKTVSKEIKQEKLYKYPQRHVFSTYKSIWRVKPDCRKMASAMLSINMINILDLGTKERKSIITDARNVHLDNVVDKNTGLEKKTCYIDMEVTDSYIYALYLNQNYDEAFEIEKETEIHVFDWQGKPLYRYRVPQYLSSITVDERNECIYGLSPEGEKLYVYKLFKM